MEPLVLKYGAIPLVILCIHHQQSEVMALSLLEVLTTKCMH